MTFIPARSTRTQHPARARRLRPRGEQLEARALLSGDLQIAESATPTTVVVGTPVQLSITVTNHDLNNASNIVVTDALPENFQYVTSNPPSGLYDPTSHIVYFNLGTLNAGASQTFNLNVVPTQVGAWSDFPSAYTATGSTSFSTTGVRITALPQNVPQADVGVQIAAFPTPTSTGSNVNFDFNVSNYGPNTADGVVVTDALPPSVSYVSSSPGGTFDAASHSVIFNLGSLAFGQTVPIQVVGTANDAGDYSDWVNVRSNAVDPVESNNDAYLPFSVHGTPTTGIADIATYQNVANTPNGVGQSNTYHTHVQNLGPGTATDVIAVDYLPAGVTYNSSSITGASGVNGVYNASNNSVTYNLGTMTAGQSIDIDLMVTATAQGTWANRMLVRDLEQNYSPSTNQLPGQPGAPPDVAALAQTQTEEQTWNNLNVGPYAILPSPLPTNTDIQITKLAAPVGPVAVGQPVTYTLTISNNGPDVAPNVLVTDQFSGQVLYQSSSPGGTFEPSLGLLTWNLGSLAANQTENVSITVVPQVAGMIQDLAIVRGGAIDTTPPNNVYVNTLNTTNAPQVQSFVWYGVHQHPTSLDVTYNQPMNPATAGDAANYRLIELGAKNRLHARGNRSIPIRSVAYLAAQQAAIVYPARHLNVHGRYALLIKGAQPGGVSNVLNVPLLDNQTFTLGGQYVQGFNYWYSGHRVPEVPGSPFTPPPTPPHVPSANSRDTARRARHHHG